ncbi:MAG: helix-turn-helix domain-containing protein [Desulfomonilaceae bacterium]
MPAPKYPEKLKRLRIRNAMSQKDIAEKMGVTQATVSNWELAKSIPSKEQKKELKKILGISATTNENGSAAEDSQVGSTSIGAWLTKERLAKNMAVPELAEAAEISPAAIYSIESGRSANPRPETISKLERALKSQVPQETKKEIREEATIEGFGELVDFDPHNKNDLPEVGGIYVLYDISERPVYVGQGSKIKRRILDHESRFWFKSPIVQSASYVEVRDQELRAQVEKLLIRFLKSNAVINKQNVDR